MQIISYFFYYSTIKQKPFWSERIDWPTKSIRLVGSCLMISRIFRLFSFFYFILEIYCMFSQEKVIFSLLLKNKNVKSRYRMWQGHGGYLNSNTMDFFCCWREYILKITNLSYAPLYNLKFILIFKIFCIKFFIFPSLINVDNMNSLILRLNFLIIDNFSFDLKCHLEVLMENKN